MSDSVIRRPSLLSWKLRHRSVADGRAFRPERSWAAGSSPVRWMISCSISGILLYAVATDAGSWHCSRLLVLGMQVLLGFEFQCFFKNRFSNLSAGHLKICFKDLIL
jgi:hypothetical protein